MGGGGGKEVPWGLGPPALKFTGGGAKQIDLFASTGSALNEATACSISLPLGCRSSPGLGLFSHGAPGPGGRGAMT